jgi:peptidoglycan/xylan/chitin deacetylase (PgdA/CDA1 family)
MNGDGDGDAPTSGGGPNQGTSSCDLPELDSAVGPVSGALTVLDWAGKDAAISYTFDDSHSSQVENYDALNALGVPFTFYLTTNWVGSSTPTWIQAHEDGHEIGNHTKSHAGTASDAEIDDATSFIEGNIGVTPLTMAAPNGSTTYSSPAMSRFLFNRGVGGGSIAPLSDANRYNLPTYIPPANADKGTLDSGVSGAVSQGNWQTVLVHGFSAGAYQAISLDGFLAHVEGQRDSGNVWIDSLVAVGSYFIGQKLLDEATPSQDGSSSTWSWTLPDHFPEGRCLRIQSTGSVSQNGTPVAQNALGYYDISLDAGQVTVQQ